MREVRVDVTPGVEAERNGAVDRADREQLRERDDVPAAGLPARDPLELAELLQGIDAHVGVGTDRDRDAALEQALDRREAVAEVRFGRGAEANTGTGVGQQVELG